MLDIANSNLLKAKLIKIKVYNYAMNDSDNAYEIALDMMKYIGSIDSELRDELIYSTFLKWTMNNVFTSEQIDALDDIAKSRYINYDELLEILHAIKTRVCIDNYTYINKEDDRMATAIMSIFTRNLIEENEIVKWIKSFGNIEKTGKYPEDHHLIVNTRNLLRSLYFLMLDQRNSEIVMEAILETLKKL